MKTKEEIRAYNREYMRKWGYVNRERKREIARSSYARNRAPYLNREALKRAESECAAPPWLTVQHWKDIAEIYDMAQRLTKLTGIYHVVDHAWPLKGKNSCGLHVPWNLQVVTHAFNVRKASKEPE